MTEKTGLELKELQELEIKLAEKEQELATQNELYQKLEAEMEALKEWNQKLYARVPVSVKEAQPENEEEKEVSPEEISELWRLY